MRKQGVLYLRGLRRQQSETVKVLEERKVSESDLAWLDQEFRGNVKELPRR